MMLWMQKSSALEISFMVLKTFVDQIAPIVWYLCITIGLSWGQCIFNSCTLFCHLAEVHSSSPSFVPGERNFTAAHHNYEGTAKMPYQPSVHVERLGHCKCL